MSDPDRWLDESSDAPDGARALLRAARSAPPMPPGVHASLDAALARAAKAGAPAAASAPWSLTARALVGLGLLGAAGFVGSRVARPSARATAVSSARPSATGAGPSMAPSIAPSIAPSNETSDRARPLVDRASVIASSTERAAVPSLARGPVRAARAVSAPRPPAEVAPTAVFAERPAAPAPVEPGESALVEAARAALRAGDVRGALQLTGAHERRFPSGIFTEERESIAVRALARAGRGDEARARAAAFLGRWPAGIYTDTVRRAAASLAEPAP